MEVAGGLTVEAMAMVVNVNDENGKCLLVRLIVVGGTLPRCPRGRKMRGGLPHISPLETGC